MQEIDMFHDACESDDNSQQRLELREKIHTLCHSQGVQGLVAGKYNEKCASKNDEAEKRHTK
jgi:hypothetical protein